jgi:hypothetical protein
MLLHSTFYALFRALDFLGRVLSLLPPWRGGRRGVFNFLGFVIMLTTDLNLCVFHILMHVFFFLSFSFILPCKLHTTHNSNIRYPIAKEGEFYALASSLQHFNTLSSHSLNRISPSSPLTSSTAAAVSSSFNASSNTLQGTHPFSSSNLNSP